MQWSDKAVNDNHLHKWEHRIRSEMTEKNSKMLKETERKPENERCSKGEYENSIIKLPRKKIGH